MKFNYFRFGAVPENGKSINFKDGSEELGVSCYRITDGRAIVDSLQESGGSFALFDRPIYLLAGNEIGIGGGGEPVIQVTASKRAANGFKVFTPFGTIEQIKDTERTGIGSLRRLAKLHGINATIRKSNSVIDLIDDNGEHYASIYGGNGPAKLHTFNSYSVENRGVQARQIPDKASNYKIW